jgi:MSHA pilin protein MshD
MTMIELLLFIIVLSFGLVATLNTLNQVTVHSVDPEIRKQALSIAEGLMEEILLARFTYCDPTDPQADSAKTAAVGALGTGCTSAAYVENFGQEAVPNAIASRPFDNVNDYVSAAGTAISYSTDVTGASFPPHYNASVTITPDPLLGPAGQRINSTSSPATMEVLRITVTVTYSLTNESVTLDGYRTRYAGASLP